MGDFRPNGGQRFSGGRGGGFDKRGGRPSFGGNKGGFRGGDRDRGPVTMHKVICDECKKPCEVPFQPMAGKPVYCSACFGGKKEKTLSGDYRTPPRTDFGHDVNKVSGSEIKKQIEVLNGKVDRLIKVIEGLTVKPVSAPAPAVLPVEKPTPVVKVKKTVKKASKKK